MERACRWRRRSIRVSALRIRPAKPPRRPARRGAAKSKITRSAASAAGCGAITAKAAAAIITARRMAANMACRARRSNYITMRTATANQTARPLRPRRRTRMAITVLPACRKETMSSISRRAISRAAARWKICIRHRETRIRMRIIRIKWIPAWMMIIRINTAFSRRQSGLHWGLSRRMSLKIRANRMPIRI